VKRPRFSQWLHTLRQPTVGLLVMLYAIAIFCFACFETTYGLLVKPLGYDEKSVGYLIAYCGVITVLVQGVIGRLVKKHGERRLIPMSLFIAGAGLAILPYVTQTAGILFGLAVLAIGAGLNRAPTLGLLSILTPPSEQGATLGVAQSAGSMARILAPIFSATAFDYKHSAPYLAAAGISIFFAILAYGKLSRASVQSAA
jgi:MFS family permease